MPKGKLSEKEKRALRNKAKAELNYMERVLTNDEKREVLDEFKNKFNVCETVCKIILKRYLVEKEGKVVDDDKLYLDMKRIPAAFKLAGYDFEKDLLTKLFGSEKKKGHKTAKKLRNAVTHGLKSEDVKEIMERKEELFGYMDQFLEKIRTFDDSKEQE